MTFSKLGAALGAMTTLALCLSGPSFAGSITVSTTTVDVVAPDVAAVVKIKNAAAAPAVAQLRVFRWSQTGGIERLEPDNDVIVSPPLARMAPGAEQTVRIMRTGASTQAGEQSFRLVIDELPPPGKPKSGSVAVVVRHVVPVFFTNGTAGKPDLDWRLDANGKQPALVLTNRGNRRIRLADLVLSDGSGKRIVVAQGLAGYVLSNSSKRIELPASAARLSRQGITATAQGDVGPIHATVQ